MSDTHLTITQFSDFNLPDAIQKGITKAGFSFCTPIQALTLPFALNGKDVAGQAQTGTGKTATFLIALFSRLLNNGDPSTRTHAKPRALIIAPTRELAIQIYNDAVLLGEFTGLNLGLAYGGLRMSQQRAILNENLDILIGTPGRLIDCFRQHWMDLRGIEVMVLDEADRMFDLGFISQIRFLLRRMPAPENRLTLLFTATLSWRVTELAYEHMNNPEVVRVVTENVTADRIVETAYYVANDEKLSLLLGLLRKIAPKRAIVFVNTKRVAEMITHRLTHNGIHCEMLSGDVPQKKRQRLIKGFAEGEFPLLIATDVAARGLHIPDVTHVFNFDLPQEPEEYVHRVGRTARVGAEGAAISFACEEYAYHLPDIEQYIDRKIPAESVAPDLLAQATETPRAASKSGGERRSAPFRRNRSPGKHQRPRSGHTKRNVHGKKPE